MLSKKYLSSIKKIKATEGGFIVTTSAGEKFWERDVFDRGTWETYKIILKNIFTEKVPKITRFIYCKD